MNRLLLSLALAAATIATPAIADEPCVIVTENNFVNDGQFLNLYAVVRNECDRDINIVFYDAFLKDAYGTTLDASNILVHDLPSGQSREVHVMWLANPQAQQYLLQGSSLLFY